MIILVVYLPVLALQDIEDKEFHPMALTVMMTLAGALAMTMLVIPAMASTFPSARPPRGDSFAVRWAHKCYTPMLRRTLNNPWITVGIAGLLFAGGDFLTMQLGGEFIPTLSEGAIVVTSNKLPSINLTESLRIVTDIEKVIRGFPDVQTVVSQTGRAEVPTDPMGVQSTDTYLILKPRGQWKTAPTQQGIQTAIKAKLKATIPGVSWEFPQPIRMRMDDLLEGARTPAALSIYGDDIGTIRSLANKAVNILRSIKGASDVQVEYPGVLPSVTISIDRSRLGRFGISAADTLAAVEAIGGHTVGTVYGQDDLEPPIGVRLAPDARSGVSRIRTLPIELANGHAVTLSDVAMSVFPKALPKSCGTSCGAARLSTLMSKDATSTASSPRRNVMCCRRPCICCPATIWNGADSSRIFSASSRLALVVPVALAAIFLLLYLNFNSLRQAALIFPNVPMAATGGIVALTLRGMPFSVTAAIGFISVFGVAILDGVVLVSYINEQRETSCGSRDAARQAAEKRLRPVLTTALVASIGFVPMAVSTSVGAAVQRPLATVVIGGLITSTLLTLLVLPSLYPVIDKIRAPWLDRIANARSADHK